MCPQLRSRQLPKSRGYPLLRLSGPVCRGQAHQVPQLVRQFNQHTDDAAPAMLIRGLLAVNYSGFKTTASQEGPFYASPTPPAAVFTGWTLPFACDRQSPTLRNNHFHLPGFSISPPSGVGDKAVRCHPPWRGGPTADLFRNTWSHVAFREGMRSQSGWYHPPVRVFAYRARSRTAGGRPDERAVCCPRFDQAVRRRIGRAGPSEASFVAWPRSIRLTSDTDWPLTPIGHGCIIHI